MKEHGGLIDDQAVLVAFQNVIFDSKAGCVFVWQPWVAEPVRTDHEVLEVQFYPECRNTRHAPGPKHISKH